MGWPYRQKPPMGWPIEPGHHLSDFVASLEMREGTGGKVFDSSERGHDGTLAGGAIWALGKNGWAIDLDGTDGEIVIPDHADFTPILTPFSISVWIYMHQATHFDIASKGVYNTDGEWEYHVHAADHVKLRLFDESEDDCFIGQISDDDLTAYENKLIHLVVTYDGGKLSSGIKHYLNGNLLNSSVNQNNNLSFDGVEAGGGAVEIGTDGTHYADGLIDIVRFWPKELTASDAAELCQEPFCMYKDPAKIALLGVRE